MLTATLTRAGNLVGLSIVGMAEIPKATKAAIEAKLTYTFQKRLYGLEKYDPHTGQMRDFLFEDRKLYKYDQEKRLCFCIGFLPRVKSMLKEAGYACEVVNLDPPRKRKKCYTPVWENIADMKFKAKQDIAVATVAANERGTIVAPPAFGKSFMFMFICKLFPYAKIDIVTKRKDIVAKTVRFLTQFIPNVGQVGGGKDNPARITVYTADSMHKSKYDADILLVDEAHELLADSYAANLVKYRYSRTFAFTATPEGRKDGTDARMEAFFGPNIFHMTYQEAEELGVVSPIRIDWLNIQIVPNPCAGKSDVPKRRWGLWRNTERNKIIANHLQQNYKDEQVLVLVDTIEHALYLRKELPEYSLCYSENGIKDEELELYRRQKLMAEDELPIDAATREQLRQDFEQGKLKKVIATGVWSTGVDFVDLQVLVRADGADGEIIDFQAPGRVCRVSSAKEYGIVVDCRDQFDPGFYRKSKKRERNYTAKGWKPLTVKQLADKRTADGKDKKTTGSRTPENASD